MEALKNLIPEHLLEKIPSTSEPEILTEEEIIEAVTIALEQARRKKITDAKIEAYRKKIMQPQAPVNVSAEVFRDWIYNKAKEEVKNFNLNPKEEDIYFKLCLYFSGDKRIEEQGWSLDKGLYLYGGVGCGKTTIMRLFMVNPRIDYGVVQCLKIADMYKEKDRGQEVVHKYSNATAICFNDLGTEIESGEASHFGNKKNVLGEIVLNHYELNHEKKYNFHFTSNFGADKIEHYYGDRFRSRLREMCNIISLEGITDKRK
jgi:DNA replication protein DnaC